MTTTRKDGADRLSAPVAVITSDGAAWTWEEMFHEFAPAIFSYARSRGVSNADDIVQEVFRSVVEKTPRIPGDRSALRSLLFTIAYRRIADEHRFFNRRRETLVADYPQIAGQDPAVEEIVTISETSSEAMKALEILSERERRVIEMRIVQEASPAEVARALGLSNGNVRVIQARALMKIRKHLASNTPSRTVVLAVLEAVRGQLPSYGKVGRWISEIRSDASKEAVQTTGLGVGAGGAAGVTVAAVGSFATSGAITASALTFGLVVSMTIGTAAGATVVDKPTMTATGDAASAMAEVRGVAVPPVVERSAPTDTTSEAEEKSHVPKASEDTTEPLFGDDVAETEETVESIDDGMLQPVVDDVQPLIEELVEPLLKETTDLVVEDVVSPTIDTVESVVEGVIEPIVQDPDTSVVEVVEPVAPVLSETTDLIVEDVVSPTIDTVESAVEGVIEAIVQDPDTSMVEVVEPVAPVLSEFTGSVLSGSSLRTGLAKE